jgi:DNA-binding SARP family transcriptional activator
VRYEILGKLRVIDHGQARMIGARKMELLLTTLLIRANRLVSTDQLITEMWEGQVPEGSTASLYVNVSHLRKFLRQGGRSASIVTRDSGYSLNLGDDELDLIEFQSHVRRAWQHHRAGRHPEAAASCESALAVWRGETIGGLPGGPIIGGFWAWLEESRLECLELLVESQLMLGRHRELVSMLFALSAEHPLRESFYRQLMLALYRSERQADALGVYRSAYDALRRELGLEPCPALKEVHRAILSADDASLRFAAPQERRPVALHGR